MRKILSQLGAQAELVRTALKSNSEDTDISYRLNPDETHSFSLPSEVEIPILHEKDSSSTGITMSNPPLKRIGNLIHGNYQEGMDTSMLVGLVITRALYSLLLVPLLLFDSEGSWMWIW